MSRYVPNRAGLREMLAGPKMVAAMHRKGERILNYAKLISPYREHPEPPVHYANSWRIWSGIRNGKAWCRVANVAPHAWFLEHGTKHMKRQRILGKSVTAARR